MRTHRSALGAPGIALCLATGGETVVPGTNIASTSSLRGSDQIADLAGSAASNRSATASRWLAAGKIFAVNHRGARLFPNFQFGTDGHPRPVIAKVLEVFEPYGLDGWESALWFTTRSGGLTMSGRLTC
jgi:hypothetical protein